ncbi:MAG TPA: hypothetical protein VFR67_01030, partial [Pilimelia sp.]|nr:hypothetical protein [Pilimelia sp.]
MRTATDFTSSGRYDTQCSQVHHGCGARRELKTNGYQIVDKRTVSAFRTLLDFECDSWRAAEGDATVSISGQVSARHRVAAPSVAEDPTLDLREIALAAEQSRLRRQISHDIYHELSTIMLLASLLGSAPELDPGSRERARQILG